jgi:hypothetical protein
MKEYSIGKLLDLSGSPYKITHLSTAKHAYLSKAIGGLIFSYA